MKIGALIIGDELLSGKRKDQHFEHLQSVLAQRELELSWTIILGDNEDDLHRFLRFSLASNDLVFSFGGIGATPDDCTRQAVAKAADVELKPHPDAIAEIEAQFGTSAYPNRILMAELPEGSRIIPNIINRVPGFSFKDHHFMPGFPEMSWPMLEWILENYYPDLKNLAPESEQVIYIINGRETELVETMCQIIQTYPNLKLSSLPHLGKQPHIEFSLRGDHHEVEPAMKLIKQAIVTAGFTWSNQLDKN